MNHKVRKIRKKLKSELDTDRYEHTLGVMYTASSLAMCHGEDIEKALLAGLLHDCAKCIYNLPILNMIISGSQKGAQFRMEETWILHLYFRYAQVIFVTETDLGF